MNRVVGLVVGLLGVAAARAEAAPATVVVPSVEVRRVPVDVGGVLQTLRSGDAVCTLDEPQLRGPGVHRRHGWLAIQLPGAVGYVPEPAVVMVEGAAAATACAPAGAASPAGMGTSPAAAVTGGAAGVGGGDGVGSAGVGGVPASGSSVPGVQLIEATGSLLPRPPGRFALSMGTGIASLQEAAAERHRIGDAGLTLNVGGSFIIADVFALSATGGVAFPSDHGSFQQDVVPVEGGGDPESAESELSLYFASVSLGLRTPFLVLGARSVGGSRGLAGALFADYGYAEVTGGRSISNCIDCRSDDLELAGGSFWRAGFDLAWTSTRSARLPGLSASYQRFLSGDMIDEVRIAFTYWM